MAHPHSDAALELSTAHVSDLVTADPRRAAVFERLGIDYCCGGKLPLEQACSERGLELAAVERQLAAATAEDGSVVRDWSTASIAELVDDIVSRHHERMRGELPRVQALAEKVARAHGAREPRLVQADEVVSRLVEELLEHTAHEEGVVFPMLLDAPWESTTRPEELERITAEVSTLVDDHSQAAERFEELHVLLDDFDPPSEACTSWRAYLDALRRLELDLHEHVHEENHVLFPKVMAGIEAAA